MGDMLALVVLLGFAAYRLARIVTRDTISEPFRVKLGQWALVTPVYDSEEDDDAVIPWKSRGHRYVHNLLTCPLCMGVWISTFLVLVVVGPPWDTRTFADWVLLVFASAGVQCLIVVKADN